MTFSLLFAVIILVLGIHIIFTWYQAVNRGLRASRNLVTSNAERQTWPRVSIIVPAWCECSTVENCIAAIQAIDYPEWESIIVAGGSDGTFALAREITKGLANFVVIEQFPLGKNAALNQGLACATGDIVVFLDADSIVRSDWLKELVRPLRGSVQATTGNILPIRVTPISAGMQMEWIKAQEVDGLNMLRGGGGIALKRTLVEQMGGLPENVPVGVDWDLNSKVVMQGIDCAYCRYAVVHTGLPSTLNEYWRNELRWRRAHLSSLFRLPDLFFGSPAKIIKSSYIYVLAWGSAVFTILAILLVMFSRGRLAPQVLEFWAVLAAWVLLRRAALAGEVAAYTRDFYWLKLAWVPPLLLTVVLVTILPASLSLRKQTIHFKGFRSQQTRSTTG